MMASKVPQLLKYQPVALISRIKHFHIKVRLLESSPTTGQSDWLSFDPKDFSRT
jgi:hypothetical protein